MSDTTEPRMDLVNHVREQIAAGTYITDGKVKATADALLNVLRNPPRLNLWELMTLASHEKDYHGKKADRMVSLLGSTARMSGQELSIEPVLDRPEGGWLIRVFSCYDDGDGENIAIHIPKRGAPRVEIE